MRLRRACCRPRLVLPDTQLASAKLQNIVELPQHKRDLADSLLEGTDMSGKISTDGIIALDSGKMSRSVRLSALF